MNLTEDMLTLILFCCFGLATMETASDTPCYHNETQVDYRGTVSRTVTGRICQKWTSQSPNQHEYTSSKYPDAGLGDHNYCRNPGAEHHRVWCYTTDPDVRWENCKVTSPEEACEFTECYHNKTQSDYRGILAQTTSGLVCQKWLSQSPHVHTYTPDSYDDDGLGDHNQCRNPGNEHHSAWCFTNDPDVRWEECKVSLPEQGCKYTECYHGEDMHDYRGTIYRTVSGKLCQRWDQQSPHEHGYSPEKFAADGVGSHNYCRNPGKDHHKVWCYTTDVHKRWENCDVSPPKLACGLTECYHDMRHIDYRGTVSVTESGRICQRWDSQLPHSHNYDPEKFSGHGIGEHNYCRNPGYDHHRAWCYTTDPHVTWENCKVPLPEEACVSDNEKQVCNTTVGAQGRSAFSVSSSVEQSGVSVTTHLTIISILLNFISLAAILYLVYVIVRRKRQNGLLSEPSYGELQSQGLS